MRIFSEISLWYSIVCFIIGLAAGWWMYLKAPQLSLYSKIQLRILFALRSLGISILLLLLLGVYIDLTKSVLEKPIIVILQDNSESITATKDSLFYKHAYPQKLNKLKKQIEKDYTVVSYTFGDSLRKSDSVTFKEKETNIANAFKDIENRYLNRNLGGIVLASDGIITSGENPIYAYQNTNLTAAIYTIALGNSNQLKDNIISNVSYNSIGFKGVPHKITIAGQSFGYENKKSTLIVYEGQTKISETNINHSKNQNFYSIPSTIIPKKTGQIIYTVVIQNQEGEASYKNNTYSFSIEVLDSRQKVLLLHGGPHPDVSAIKKALESNKKYELEVASINDFASSVNNYNCIVLIGTPQAYGKSTQVFNQIIAQRIPYVMVYNKLLDIHNFRHVGVEISNPQIHEEAQMKIAKEFDLFDTQDLTQFLEDVPPLLVPFGDYKKQINTQVLCNQNILGVSTNKPAIVFYENQQNKSAAILGEGIWRWRIEDYRKNKNFDHFDAFINKIVTYLSLQEKRELFSVSTKKVIYENESAIFQSQVLNKSFEPISGKIISLQLRNKLGKKFSYTFTENNGNYSIDMGNLSPGEYSYISDCIIDNKKYQQTGNLVVLPMQIEYTQLQANHDILEKLSLETNGKLVSAQNIDSIFQKIIENPDISTIKKESRTRSLLQDCVWLFVLVISLLSVEWFLRKYYGSY